MGITRSYVLTAKLVAGTKEEYDFLELFTAHKLFSFNFSSYAQQRCSIDHWQEVAGVFHVNRIQHPKAALAWDLFLRETMQVCPDW